MNEINYNKGNGKENLNGVKEYLEPIKDKIIEYLRTEKLPEILKPNLTMAKDGLEGTLKLIESQLQTPQINSGGKK